VNATVVNKTNYAISTETKVRITATPVELKELREALRVVDRFKLRALKAAKAGKDADWTTVGYAVKSDCALVTVEQGMAG
jgi:hypothetical protein